MSALEDARHSIREVRHADPAATANTWPQQRADDLEAKLHIALVQVEAIDRLTEATKEHTKVMSALASSKMTPSQARVFLTALTGREQ